MALDRYVTDQAQLGLDLSGMKARELAGNVGIPRGEMSLALQEYRIAQEHHATRYTVACEGYGRAALWHITSKPGDDPVEAQEARVRATKQSLRDGANRQMKDFACEILPAISGHSAQTDPMIGVVVNMATTQIGGILDGMVGALDQLGVLTPAP